jgi:hypothetical protein
MYGDWARADEKEGDRRAGFRCIPCEMRLAFARWCGVLALLANGQGHDQGTDDQEYAEQAREAKQEPEEDGDDAQRHACTEQEKCQHRQADGDNKDGEAHEK